MENSRYNRQTILPEIGLEGQEKLQKAKVLIVGAGGLGVAVLPYLVGAGVGEIGIIDDDVIAVSNLQRQVIYKTSSVGKSKVLEAKAMALELNPFVKVNAIQEKLTPKNALSLFKNYDIIVDATDNLATKYLINDACCVTNKPFVYGSVFKFEGQVSVFNYKNGPTYRCLFQEEKTQSANCNEIGVLGTSVGIIGMLQATEVLKMILEIGTVLYGKLLIYSILNNEQQKFEFAKNEFIVVDKSYFESKYALDANPILEIEAEEALQQIDNQLFLFLDVRNLEESPKMSFENGIQIPLSDLENGLHLLDSNAAIFVFCQSGMRSKTAVAILNRNGFKNVKSIVGGINEILEYSQV
jgi:sulfur-carrier protein adenylyltransferase/sulfurtransferase